MTTGEAVPLLEHLAEPLAVVDGLTRLDRLEPLDGWQSLLLAVVRRLLPEADVLEVTQAVAHVNDALTRRLLLLAEEAYGPPPGAYSWLALGSHGRGEQVLSSDQDSALAYDDASGPSAAEYYPRLAEAVVSGLARAGLPLCSGGFMATRWSRPLGELRTMFAGWVDDPQPESLLRAEVFLDVRPVHGALAVDVLDRTLVVGGSRGPFRVQMARAAVSFRPPLTVFGRVRASDGCVDVKRGGTAAIVLLARLHALSAGSSARTTVERLQAGAEGGTVSRQGAAELVDAYRFLTGLRLRVQVEQVGRGEPAGNDVRPDDLTPAERAHLRDVLRHVRDVQTATASRYATHTVT